MNNAVFNFWSGQEIRLVRAVIDDETGYQFLAGTPAQFEQYLAGEFCSIAVDASLGDSKDSGTVEVMVRIDDIESA